MTWGCWPDQRSTPKVDVEAERQDVEEERQKEVVVEWTCVSDPFVDSVWKELLQIVHLIWIFETLSNIRHNF
jgi:hypothetical protein